jgi:hypothetical protein
MHGQRYGDKKKLYNVIAVAEQAAPLSESIQAAHAGVIGAEPWERTHLLYTSTKDLRWKQSYRSRILGSRETGGQLLDAISILAARPGTSSACCMLGRPEDLRRARVIPSTVPCPLTLDFKSVDKKLNMTAFFRAQDVARLGLPDLHYLAGLLHEIVSQVNERRLERQKSGLHAGHLIFHLCVGFVRTKDGSRLQELLSI